MIMEFVIFMKTTSTYIFNYHIYLLPDESIMSNTTLMFNELLLCTSVVKNVIVNLACILQITTSTSFSLLSSMIHSLVK